MSRRFFLAANWKMNAMPLEAVGSSSPYRARVDLDVVVFPTALDIPICINAKLLTGGQSGRPEPSGAHTGDISMELIKAAGCHHVLCGHSERRAQHGETNEDVAEQVIAALEVGLHPIVCVGETEAQRDAGKHHAVVKEQIESIPLHGDLTLAYEPVWAIGTGKTATPAQAQEMHVFIRSLLPEDRRENVRILYGGSVKPENATELLNQEDIDGALVGGASLDAMQFTAILNSALSLLPE